MRRPASPELSTVLTRSAGLNTHGQRTVRMLQTNHWSPGLCQLCWSFLSSNFSYWGPEIKLIESTVLYLPKKLAIFCRTLEVRAYFAPTMVYHRFHILYLHVRYWVSESLWFARDNLELLLLDCKIYFTDALTLARHNLKCRVHHYYS